MPSAEVLRLARSACSDSVLYLPLFTRRPATFRFRFRRLLFFSLLALLQLLVLLIVLLLHLLCLLLLTALGLLLPRLICVALREFLLLLSVPLLHVLPPRILLLMQLVNFSLLLLLPRGTYVRGVRRA